MQNFQASATSYPCFPEHKTWSYNFLPTKEVLGHIFEDVLFFSHTGGGEHRGWQEWERIYCRPCPLCLTICLPGATTGQVLGAPWPLPALPAGPAAPETLLRPLAVMQWPVLLLASRELFALLAVLVSAALLCCSYLVLGESAQIYDLRSAPSTASGNAPPVLPHYCFEAAECQPACLLVAAVTGLWPQPGTIRSLALMGTAALVLAVWDGHGAAPGLFRPLPHLGLLCRQLLPSPCLASGLACCQAPTATQQPTVPPAGSAPHT